MRMARLEMLIIVLMVAAAVAFYASPIGLDFVAPLLLGSAQYWVAMASLALTSVVVLGVVACNLYRMGYATRLLLPLIGLTSAGGLSILAANVFTPDGWQRLSNSVDQFGILALLKVVMGFGMLSCAVVFGAGIGIMLAVVKFLGRRERAGRAGALTGL